MKVTLESQQNSRFQVKQGRKQEIQSGSRPVGLAVKTEGNKTKREEKKESKK